MKLFFWIFGAFVFFLIAVRWLERSSVYFPVKVLGADPGLLGLRFENVFFNTPDGKRLNGWWVPAPASKATILFCHGNAGNISHRLDKISLLHGLGLSVFIFDYRGYGQSQGIPSEPGIYRDSQAAYDYLVKERGLNGEQIVLYGESLGGAAAIDLAACRKVRGIILEGTFTSAKYMSRIIFPVLPPGILASRFDSLHKVKRIKCPKLILHSRDDEMVPYAMSEKLFETAGLPKEFLTLNGRHNTAFLDSKEIYLAGIRDFLKDLA